MFLARCRIGKQKLFLLAQIFFCKRCVDCRMCGNHSHFMPPKAPIQGNNMKKTIALFLFGPCFLESFPLLQQGFKKLFPPSFFFSFSSFGVFRLISRREKNLLFSFPPETRGCDQTNSQDDTRLSHLLCLFQGGGKGQSQASENRTSCSGVKQGGNLSFGPVILWGEPVKY